MEVQMKKSIRSAYMQAVDLSNHNRSDSTAYEILSFKKKKEFSRLNPNFKNKNETGSTHGFAQSLSSAG